MNVTLKKILVLYMTMITCISGISTDCPTLMNLLRGLNMHLTNLDLFQRIPMDCCNYFSSDTSGYIATYCEGYGSSQVIKGLNIGNFKLNGTIQSQYIPGNMTVLDIRNTALNCSIPGDLPNQLVGLYLLDNALQGAIPNTLPANLVEFEVTNNQLTALPTSFPSSMTYLNLNNNGFTTMPNLPPNIEIVNIENNFIFEKMPSHFPNSLRVLTANRNIIYGSISANISIGSLRLNYNQINESISDFPEQLYELRVNNNFITGHLPQKWPDALSTLDVSHNLLSGNIKNVSVMTSIYFYDYSWNLFTGNLPSLHVSDSMTIDFSHNELSGDIDLGYTIINDLRLNHNKFKKFPKSLPQYLESFKMNNNEMSGTIKYIFESTLKNIDISCNNFTGNVPNWPIYQSIYWPFDDSRVSFNISHNKFTGNIPYNLSFIPTLDVSHNYLSGCIDFQLTGKYYFLNHNYLSGNLSFDAPFTLYLQNNSLLDVSIANEMNLQQCDLSENPLGVFDKTFYNLCNWTFVNETYYKTSCDIKIFGFEPVEITTTQIKSTTVPPTVIKRILSFT
eukprot:NODE_279_length_10886_cov_0.340039.p1 type:complete len:562 gc:universal NODE_279_length_10886_cov_0.340039:613-2298(+)